MQNLYILYFVYFNSNDCLYVASTGISGTVIYHLFFFGSGLQGVPVAILFFIDVELHLFSHIHWFIKSFCCFIHDFLFGKFWLVLFQHGTWDTFVNYFVVQWRLSSTIALCLWAFWSKDCSRKKTLLIMAVTKTYWKWHDCVWLSLAAPVAICSRPLCSLWHYHIAKTGRSHYFLAWFLLQLSFLR